MEKDNLEELKKRLYKKGESFDERGKRSRIYGRREGIAPSRWQAPTPKKRLSFKPLKAVFAFAVIFFLLSMSVFFYFWLGGGNIVSPRNIGIEIKGPVYVQGGEAANINIFIENRNKSSLESADLVIDFPQGSFNADGEKMEHERYSLGVIEPGKSVKKPMSVIFFGDKDEKKNIKITLEYRLAQSNAIFAKSAEYTVKISRPPIGVSISIPEEINAREELGLDIGIVSNSETIIKNLVLRVEYPSGFQFSGAVPKPSEENNIWQVGDFKPSEERKFSIKGIIEGQDSQEKAFRAEVGIIKNDGSFVSYGASAETLAIKKPYLDLALFIDGKNSQNTIAFSGDSLRAELVWRNNLSVAARNATVEIKIKGKAVNEKTISVSNGFYRTFDKTLVWNSSSLPQLASIEPGETGSAQFSFKILDPLPVKGIKDKNFIINVGGGIDAKVVSESIKNTKIHSELEKEIKIGSPLQLASLALHYSGHFKNNGPMPPKVGQETTYTIVWSLGNALNDFSAAKIKAGLPSYVRWLGNVSPVDADIHFDDVAGDIIWNAGDIPAGTGIIRPAKEVSFQVSFAPSVSQINSSPDLISQTHLEAKDNFINQILKNQKNALTTMLFGDPKFNRREGIVGN